MTRALLLLTLALSGCYTPTQKVTVRVELPAELAGRIKELRVVPAIAELRRESGSGVVALELKRAADHVYLTSPGACKLRIGLENLPTDRASAFAMHPLFDVGWSERVIGLGKDFEIRAEPQCAEAGTLRTSFAVTGGAPLERISVTQEGRRFAAATRATPPPVPATPGIVPVSARAQRELHSELTFRVELGAGAYFERRLGISAVARANGLEDIAVAHPVLLGGEGWQLLDKPEKSQAVLRSVGKLFELLPDAAGPYTVADHAGRKLGIRTGRYDQVPLDCGFSPCHAPIAESIRDSPMTQVLASDLGGCHSLSDPSCATACHAIGEPGTADGGFAHVATELELPALPADFEELPPALRRLGGVGCLACHGASKIPDRARRFAVMKTEVCAVCHDAPPRYGHVQAFESTRMAHADLDPKARSDRNCVRCHTAWGAVGREPPPANATPFGLTCATCHAVHAHQPGKPARQSATHVGLLREFPLPDTLPNPPASLAGVSRVCVSCHAPSSDTLRPEASAAALVANRGGIEPATGAPLELAAPHAQAPKGCLSCHDAGPEGLVLGQNHGFRATEQACVRCHVSPPARDPSIAARARELLARLDPKQSAGDVGKPWHASYQLLLPTPQQTRALRNVLLVLEDPAADVHGPSYARALLDTAERVAPPVKP